MDSSIVPLTFGTAALLQTDNAPTGGTCNAGGRRGIWCTGFTTEAMWPTGTPSPDSLSFSQYKQEALCTPEETSPSTQTKNQPSTGCNLTQTTSSISHPRYVVQDYLHATSPRGTPLQLSEQPRHVQRALKWAKEQLGDYALPVKEWLAAGQPAMEYSFRFDPFRQREDRTTEATPGGSPALQSRAAVQDARWDLSNRLRHLLLEDPDSGDTDTYLDDGGLYSGSGPMALTPVPSTDVPAEDGPGNTQDGGIHGVLSEAATDISMTADGLSEKELDEADNSPTDVECCDTPSAESDSTVSKPVISAVVLPEDDTSVLADLIFGGIEARARLNGLNACLWQPPRVGRVNHPTN
ncbi:hypothetical protein OE88DRAFT_214435 [Heliocybe sulcata]|uniref:Uncharacterized protein n=1 Tax=Heliocybe sulcata TaxID=5364 RepID=A0A5C3N3P1_9AGAM|nr:hypothetical protein OE88DRAFT_214435 [Heliocybe sulcata]